MFDTRVKQVILASLLAFIFMSILIFWGKFSVSEASADVDTPETETSHRFKKVETGGSYIVYYDQYTKVMYAVSNGVDNRGIFSVLYDSDGSLLLYEED